ncbi:TetR/AcrR family transcriptional regulator [Mucilaginibacter conchicola]|uniref:TetR/AcrR family transcriptional regulator n=1 Tax=Mucilaginibacter conchicola TaxID=2303333 RepID=A0A372NU55_9SPHI|nr:TetR/AcrR family transcriptional regulator [Mucilaginibacter conchicola]RFZ92632.1 TetR/AcrR family transcriptional regulator [Mucilaginibacter conchicola]
MAFDAEGSTEEKIKDAARKIFTKKGFLATTIRDIAAEAGINLASVNYYFRSKEKLFESIMDETISKLFNQIEPVLNDKGKSIEEKLEICVAYYIDNMLQNPDFVFFTVGEIMSGRVDNPGMIAKIRSLEQSHFAQQLKDLHAENKIDFHPINLLWNITSMVFFPFLTRPRLLESGYFNSEEFAELMQERKKLVPFWITQMIETKKP